jgi:AAHS family 4-hydroxybenzoate transporter-like MFS transporter
VRATGGGWASFVAKFAAVAAPIFGARFLAGRAGAMAGYSFTALCLCGIVMGVLALAYFARRLRPDVVATDALNE